ncbi:MAG: hypothetical protein IKF14_13665 [Atopobiaceae bacterium]|nr:hypothetical protein [Atopobiaceae bacterium]
MSRPRRVSGPRPYFKSRDRCERNATLAVSALTLNEYVDARTGETFLAR